MRLSILIALLFPLVVLAQPNFQIQQQIASAGVAASGGGACSPAYVSQTNFATTGTVSGHPFTINATSSGGAIVVGVSVYSGAGPPITCTNLTAGVGGEAVALTNSYNTANGFAVFVFTNPPSGNNVIWVTNTTGGNFTEFGAGVAFFSCVNTTGPIGAPVTQYQAATTSESESVTGTSSSLFVHVISHGASSLGTLGGGETQIFSSNADGNAATRMSWKAGSASTTVSSSGWPSGAIAGVGIELKQ